MNPRLVTEFEDNLSLTYPHACGFAGEGRFLILGGRTARTVSLWKLDVAGGTREKLCEFDREAQPDGQLWADVARDRLVTVADNAVWTADLRQADRLRPVFRARAPGRLQSLPGIHPDGRRAVCGLEEPGRWSALEVDLSSGEARVLFTKDWFANHFHYCARDPAWVGFSHEGRCSEVTDRVWAWHRESAPQGRCVFEQYAGDDRRTLYAGHECWGGADVSALVVCYGEGPGRPRGIYEAFADGRPQRLVSEGDRDWHLSASRDGRWVAIDTAGPHDLPGCGGESSGRNISDVLVLDRATGRRQVVGRTRVHLHPSHPHPAFSPDGRHVFYNEADPATGDLNRVWRADNPFHAASQPAQSRGLSPISIP